MHPPTLLTLTLTLTLLALLPTPSLSACPSAQSTNHTAPAVRAAVIEFYHAMNGPHWKVQCANASRPATCWLAPPWEDEGLGEWAFLLWPGLNPTPGRPKHKVKDHLSSIELNEYNLTGSFPADPTLLAPMFPRLSVLVLSNNAISGALPPCLLSHPQAYAPALFSISLPNNNLHGPLTFGNSSAGIKRVYLDHNSLDGPLVLPTETNIQTLDVSHNKLSGSVPYIPSSIASLAAGSNQLSGELPSTLCTPGPSSKLEVLDLSANHLNGSLGGDNFNPFQRLSSCSNLQEAILARNRFSSVDVLFSVSMKSFTIAFNDLQDPFELLLASLANIYYLDASYNNMTGPIPRPAGASTGGATVAANTLLIDVGANDYMRSDVPLFDQDDSIYIINPNVSTIVDDTTYCNGILSAIYPYQTLRVPPSYFAWDHCSCRPSYYGIPPNNCYPCPPNAICPGGTTFSWPTNYFPEAISAAAPPGPHADHGVGEENPPVDPEFSPEFDHPPPFHFAVTKCAELETEEEEEEEGEEGEHGGAEHGGEHHDDEHASFSSYQGGRLGSLLSGGSEGSDRQSASLYSKEKHNEEEEEEEEVESACVASGKSCVVSYIHGIPDTSECSLCEKGYTSRLCSKCDSEYFRTLEGECKPCPSVRGQTPLIVALSLLAVLLFCVFANFFFQVTVVPHTLHAHVSPPSSTLGALCRFMGHLWRETGLLALEIAVLVAFVLVGLAETFEVVILGIGMTLLTAYFVVHRLSASRDAAAHAHGAHSSLINEGNHPGAGSDSGSDWTSSGSSSSGGGSEDSHDAAMCGLGVFVASKEEAAEHIESVLKSLVIYLQTVGAIVAGFSVSWARAVVVFGAVIEKANLQFTGLECNGIGFGGAYYLFLAILPFTTTLILLAFLVRRAALWAQARRARRNLDREHRGELVSPLLGGAGKTQMLTRHQLRKRVARASFKTSALALKCVLVVGYMMLFPMAVQSTYMFSCAPVQFENGHSNLYLQLAPWIECGSHEQGELRAVGGATLAFLLGSIFILAALIWRAYRTRERALASGTRPPHSMVLSASSFILSAYKSDLWWFECAVSLRRLLFAFALSVLPQGSVFIVPLLQAILTASLLAHLLLYPLISKHANRLETLSLLASLASLQIASAMQATSNSQSLTALSLVFVFGNGIVLLLYIFALALPLIALFWAQLRRTPH